MDPLPWVLCVREMLDYFSPSYLSQPIPKVCLAERSLRLANAGAFVYVSVQLGTEDI